MLIDRVCRARVEGFAGPCDIELGDGHVTAVLPSGGVPPAATAGAFDAAGRVVVPAFVDAHVHLDKAYLWSAAEREGGVEPRLDAAIRAVESRRATINPDAVHANAERALATLARHGVVAARAHVEVEPRLGLELLDLHHALAEAPTGVALQLVAFPQLGLEAPGALDLLGAAMEAGAAVVGGCPYVDDDPARHLDAVFALAQCHGAPVDVHLDFSDDAGRSCLDLVIERTVALGMEGDVTVGHATTLAVMPVDAQRAVLDRMAAAGIALVVLPATDLYLGGHGEPGLRSLAPVERAAAAGVRVAIANNNIANPFAPFGDGSLVHAAWLVGVTRRLAGCAGGQLLHDPISTNAAAILGRPAHGPVVDRAADLVVLDTTEPSEAIAQAPGVVATLRAGALC